MGVSIACSPFGTHYYRCGGAGVHVWHILYSGAYPCVEEAVICRDILGEERGGLFDRRAIGEGQSIAVDIQ